MQFKIKEVVRDMEGNATLIPTNKKVKPVKVNAKFITKYNPEKDGYFVKDENGLPTYSKQKPEKKEE